MFADVFFDFPYTFEIRLYHKGITGHHSHRGAAIRRDCDPSRDQHHIFIGGIGGMIAANRAFPDARNHIPRSRRVQRPGFHRRAAFGDNPAIKIGG